MTDRAWVDEDLVVVAPVVALITKEVDLIISLLNKLQAERLVPSFWEYVEWDLSPNTIP